MHSTQKSSSGFSLIFAIALIAIVWSMSLYLLSFIVPYSRNVKWLEHSAKAYYLWNAAVEQALWDVKHNSLWYENSDAFSGAQDYAYDIVANGTRIPELDFGNSNFDSDWNIVGFGEPIQLSVWDGLITDWSLVNFDFRVPDLNQDGNNTDQTVLGNSSTVVLSWQLSSATNTLLPNGTGAFISASDINNPTTFTMWSLTWRELDGTTLSLFSAFYNTNCGSGNNCILKISTLWNMFVNDVNTTTIPYLEYYVDTWPFSIPTRFTNINVSGKSFGFRKDINVKVPQLTTDQAFDFTVFQ